MSALSETTMLAASAEAPKAVPTGHLMYDMDDNQFQLVYNILSFSLASMMATTVFLWLRIGSMHEKFKAAVTISGIVTFIAAYHYIRIFNSWCEAYAYPPIAGFNTRDRGPEVGQPKLTGVPFNDAYRYMDWLLTVPLLLIEIVLVMNMSAEESSKKCWSLGVSSALMIIIGYPGELYLTPETVGKRLMYWAAAMVPFIYIVYELVVGLSAATNSEKDPKIRSAIRNAQLYTVFSWCTYPIVYIIPIFGAQGSSAVCGIQVGYCVSDIISKCGVGLLIYNVSVAKTKAIAEGSLLVN